MLVTVLAASWMHAVGTAGATTRSVATEAEWRDALEAASNDATGPQVIEITADFVISTAGTPYYYGDEDLTVHGNGHTVTGSAADTGFLWIISFPPFVTIEGFTVRDFTKTGVGAVNLESSGSLVEHMAFIDNEAWDGGAVSASRTTVRHSTFSGNRATGDGGNRSGGAVSGNSLTIEDSTFDHNVAGDCGAIGFDGFADDNTLTGNHFEANEADGSDRNTGIGGAVCMLSGRLSDNTFVGNHAAVYGGALSTHDALIERSTFLDNASGDEGGAVRANQLRVDASTFSGNRAPRGAAALAQSISSGPSSVDLTNSTFTGNVSTGAGGAVIREASPEPGTTRLRYVTFAGNQSSGGAADVNVEGGGLEAYGTVFADPAGGPSCTIVGAVTSSYSYATDDSCDLDGTGDTDDAASPQLGPLADNGGATLTMAPAATSPLVDAIALDDCDRDLLVDQRGESRPRASDDTTPDYGCDIGAVEIGVARELPTTTTSTSTTSTSTTTPTTTPPTTTPPTTTSTTAPPAARPSGVARPVSLAPRFTG